MAVLAPALLIAIGVYGLVLGGRWLLLPSLLFVAGLVLATITLFDVPLRTSFGVRGIERHMLLRKQLIAWEKVMVLERFRKRNLHVPGWMNLGEDRAPRLPTPGGLVALTTARRRYLLINQGESQTEYDALLSAVSDWAPDLVVNASRPHDKVPPTFLYRKRS
jgi:hypothetical protein